MCKQLVVVNQLKLEDKRYLADGFDQPFYCHMYSFNVSTETEQTECYSVERVPLPRPNSRLLYSLIHISYVYTALCFNQDPYIIPWERNTNAHLSMWKKMRKCSRRKSTQQFFMCSPADKPTNQQPDTGENRTSLVEVTHERKRF